jgi:RNA polymerase sigma-70 factor (ECF subfamily)
VTERRRFFRPHLAFSGGRRLPGGPAPAPDGRAERFRELVLPHLDSAYNFARYLAKDPSAAEDIVQTAFLRAFRGFGGFRGEAPKAWLFAIVRRSFLDWKAASVTDDCELEEAARTADQKGAMWSDAETPEEIVARAQERDGLRACVSALPEPFREVVILRELEELSYKEIAAIAQVPIGTVMSRLARARDMLAELVLSKDANDRRALS